MFSHVKAIEFDLNCWCTVLGNLVKRQNSNVSGQTVRDTYEIVRELGSGITGTVKVVQKKGTENLFAMKEVNIKK